jgi:AcrR family transcriptional regulator
VSVSVPVPSPRRRDAAATRAAILDAARRRFAAVGYDGASVRDIAAGAGIDPALVIRYFGSKDGLFREAIGAKFDLRPVVDGDRQGLALRLARAMLSKPAGAVDADPLHVIARSAQSEPAAAILQEAIQTGVVAPLAAAIGGADADRRAALIASVLLGVFVGRSTLALPPLAGDPERLAGLCAAALQPLIDGDPAPGGGPA